MKKTSIPSGSGRSCPWCWFCLPKTKPSRTLGWACPGSGRCWPCAPLTSSAGCCTAGWNARPWPAPSPAPPSEGRPGGSSQSSLGKGNIYHHHPIVLLQKEPQMTLRSPFPVQSGTLMLFSLSMSLVIPSWSAAKENRIDFDFRPLKPLIKRGNRLCAHALRFPIYGRGTKPQMNEPHNSMKRSLDPLPLPVSSISMNANCVASLKKQLGHITQEAAWEQHQHPVFVIMMDCLVTSSIIETVWSILASVLLIILSNSSLEPMIPFWTAIELDWW